MTSTPDTTADNEPIVTCECSADPPRTAEECRQWNAQHNPGAPWAEQPCDCDCHEDDAADVPAASTEGGRIDVDA